MTRLQRNHRFFKSFFISDPSSHHPLFFRNIDYIDRSYFYPINLFYGVFHYNFVGCFRNYKNILIFFGQIWSFFRKMLAMQNSQGGGSFFLFIGNFWRLFCLILFFFLFSNRFLLFLGDLFCLFLLFLSYKILKFLRFRFYKRIKNLFISKTLKILSFL